MLPNNIVYTVTPIDARKLFNAIVSRIDSLVGDGGGDGNGSEEL